MRVTYTLISYSSSTPIISPSAYQFQKCLLEVQREKNGTFDKNYNCGNCEQNGPLGGQMRVTYTLISYSSSVLCDKMMSLAKSLYFAFP